MLEITEKIIVYLSTLTPYVIVLSCVVVIAMGTIVLFNGRPNWITFKNSVKKLRELWSRITGRAQIMCPFCLEMTPQEGEICSNEKCTQRIPPLYKERYFKQPVIMLNAVGFREHGKTVYLTSLFNVCELFARKWEGFAEQTLNQDSMEKVLEWSYQLRQRKLPPPNEASDLAKPSIHLFTGLPFSSPDRLLLIYDTSGEHYGSVNNLKEYAQFVKNSPAILFFISMPTIRKEKDSPDLVMKRLIDVYRQGMAEMGKPNTRHQHLIVVYTQADAMLQDLTDYPEIIEHIRKPVGYVPGNIKELERISEMLKKYTCSFAANFHNNLTHDFASVRYCIVSALGHAPNSSSQYQLDFDPEPKRVLEPLLWLVHDTGQAGENWFTPSVHETYKGYRHKR